MAGGPWEDFAPAAPPPSGEGGPWQDFAPQTAGLADYAIEAGKAFLHAPVEMIGGGLRGYGANQAGAPVDQLARMEQANLPPEDDSPHARAAYRTRRGVQHPSADVQAERRALWEQQAATPIEENPLFAAGQWVSDAVPALKPAPGWEDSWTTGIAGGFGSVAGGIGASMIPGVGPGLAGTIFLGAGMGEAVDRAMKAGATKEQAILAARQGAIAGATDLVDALLPMLGSTGKAMGLIKRIGTRTLYGALAEGGQEALQQSIQNAIAKGIYKPDQDLLEDVPKSFLIGAIVGGTVSGGQAAMSRPQAAQPAQEEPAADEFSSRARAAPTSQPAAPAEPPPAPTPEDREWERVMSGERGPPEGPWNDFANSAPATPAAERPWEQGVVPAVTPATERQPTVPESPETLQAQQEQLIEGDRDVQLFPEGKGELPLPEGMAKIEMENGDVFHFNPEKVSAVDIVGAHEEGRENELLGLGPFSKDEALERAAQGEQPVAVVERTPDGTEVRTAAGTEQTAQAQIEAINQVKSPDSTVRVEQPEQVLQERRDLLQPETPDISMGAPERRDLSDQAKLPDSPPSAPIVMVAPQQLNVDPKRFQYKASDDKGVTGALQGVVKWDDRLANPITAWQDPAGRLWVVNGHQRTDLAKRATAGGQPNVQVPARVYSARDGFTPEYMRALGAFQNIAEGTGSAIDAAKVLRANIQGLDLPPLPPKSPLVQDAKALAALGDDAFGMVVNEIVPAAYAAQVGQLLKDPTEQLAALDALAKAEPANVNQARLMVEDIRNSGFLKGEQTSLFGEQEFARSLVAERARILDRAQRTLRVIGRTFKTAVEQEKTLAEAGNKLKRATNVKAQSENERLAEIIRANGTRKGPISDALSDAAKQLADGSKPISAATSTFLAQVRSLARGSESGNEPRTAAGGDRPAKQAQALYSLDAGRKTEPVELAKGEKGEQYVLPGAERASDADLARRGAAAPSRPKAPQKPAEGLFGAPQQGERQQSLFDQESPPRQTVGKGTAHAADEQVRKGTPEVPARKQAKDARRSNARRRVEGLSLFDWGSGREQVRDDNKPDEPSARDTKPAAPQESVSVTKPPSVSGGNRPRRNRLPAERGLEEAREKIAQRSKLNYRITDEDRIGEGGPKEKVRANIEAIRTLQAIEEEGRQPTPEEKAKLVRYTGWGAFAQQIFADHKGEWKTERETLRSLLSEEDYAAARASTPNAHYTSPEVVRGMWDALDHLGYTGGLAIEPSAGIGHFIGLIPDSMAPSTAWTAVELDTTTGKIAKALYGGADVNIQGYETLKRPSNYYDLAISNVPFGDYNISERPHGSHSIHDFFFIKSIDKVRPGGVVAFITSRFTLDQADQSIRRRLARDADLIGAIRLPGGTKGAFAKNAGTEVTTDIIFLRKKIPGERPYPQSGWIETKEIKTPDGPARINEYFANNPEMMLGEMRLQGKQYRADEPVLIGEIENIRARIASAAMRNMEPGAFTPRGMPQLEEIDSSEMDPSLKDGAIFLKDGKVYQRVTGRGVELHLSKDDTDRVRRLSELRTTFNDLLAAQLGNEDKGTASDLRKQMQDQYNSFVKKWGPINKEVRTVTSRLNKAGEPVVITKLPNIAAFSGDPDVWKVASIENYDPETDKAKPAPIQTKDVIDPPTVRQINGPADALAASLDDTGKIDLNYIANALDVDTLDEAAKSLGDLVYLNPNGRQWEAAQDYLSGDVVKKLEDAREIAKTDSSFKRNVEALEKVQPEPIPASEITAQFGAPWIPDEVYTRFVKDELGADSRSFVNRVPITGEWRVSVNYPSRDARARFSNDRVDVQDVVKAALSNQQITVWNKNDDGSRTVNEAVTADARAKTEALRELFVGDPNKGIDSWVWSDPERAAELAAIYNRTFNNLVGQKFDGTHLTLPGLNPMFKDRQHRKDAVWRMITSGNTLLAHVVGSGKTVTMIAGGMEMKRLGLINKPAYVIPNHMLEQFSREFIQAYPNAKILVAEKEEMTPDKRRAFMAKVSANDWDGVIITHDAFGRVNMDRKFREGFIRDQLDELEQVLKAEIREEGKSAPTVKGLEKAKKRLQDKLQKLMNEDRKDAGVTFEESGIDFLFVDEAHKFKNLAFVTKMQRVKGLAQGESQRAEDLFLKIRYLESKRPGRSAVFATGTPVSNTMAELWTMQRYLQMEALRERGLETFDAWANTFGRVVTNAELSADGRTMKDVSSFSNFVNIPELIAVYSRIADTKTADMLNLPRPEVVAPNGKKGIEIVQVDPSPEEEKYIDDLVKLAESLKGKPPKKGEPNMLSVVTRGRKVATDGRLVGLPVNEGGKIATAARNIYKIWKEGKEPGTVQMVFLDLGVPVNKRAKKVQDDDMADPAQEGPSFDLYADLRQRLIKSGIPANQIAAIHDATDDEKKGKLFKRVRAGDVRVIIGSSEKMGVGTNVQDRLIAMHHLDAPWKPAEVEQRDGRIIRQGNMNPNVRILRYVTQRSFDAFMWQALDRKAKFIGQVLSGAKGIRVAEDADNPLPEAAEMMAAASGDMRILDMAELERQVRQLSVQRNSFANAKARAASELKTAEARIAQIKNKLPAAIEDSKKAQDLSGDKFTVTLGGQEFTNRAEAGAAILDRLVGLEPRNFYSPKAVKLGTLSGFEMQINVVGRWSQDGSYLRGTPSLAGAETYSSPSDFVLDDKTDAAGLMRRFTNLLDNIRVYPSQLEQAIDGEEAGLTGLRKTASQEWPKEKEYRDTIAKRDALAKEMKADKKDQSSEAGIPSRAASSLDTGAAITNSSGEALPVPSTQPPFSQASIRPAPSESSTTRKTPPSIFDGPATTPTISGLEIGAIDAASNKKILHGSNDVNALASKAEENKPLVINRLTELAEDIPGTKFYGARVKDTPGLQAKITAKKRPPSTISDYLGARVVVDTPQAMHAFVKRLNDLGAIIEEENFISNEGKDGYRAYHLQVGSGDGTSFELQLVPRKIVEVMDEAHAVRQPVKRLDLSKPAEFAKFKEVMAESRRIFNDAWSEAGSDWQTYRGPDTAELARLTPKAKKAADAIESRLSAIIRRVIGNHANVAFQDQIKIPRAAIKAWGSYADGLTTAAGSYVPAYRLIMVAMNDPRYQSQSRTAYHESFHAVEDLLLNNREMAVLKKAEPQLRNIVQSFAELSPKQSKELADYEVRAIAFEAYSDARDNKQPVTNFPAAVRVIFDRLRNLLGRVRNAMNGLGFKTVDDVFSDVYEGKTAERTARERGRFEDMAASLQPPNVPAPLPRGRRDLRIIDRTFRAPFDIFGGTNAKGEWEPGLKLSAKAENIIANATFDDNGRFRALNPMLHKARAGLIDRYGLDPKYVQRDRDRTVDMSRIMRQVPELIAILRDANVTPTEAVVLQDILTGKPVQDARLTALAEPIRKAIDDFGQAAVDYGLLSQEAYDRNKGSYLHRVYQKHETDTDKLTKFFSKMASDHRKKILGDQFKGRGLWKEVSAKAAGNPAKGDRITRNGHEWEVRGLKGDKAIIWRDWTEQEREQMGEILDARYTIAKTFMQAAHDLSIGRFFKDIAENPDWARSSEPGRGTWKLAGEYSRFWADPSIEWVKVPDTTISQSNTKRYGLLAGKFVRAEIWRDMQEAEAMQTPAWWTHLVNQWKLNKTVRSPVVHMNNVMSNMVLMDMADVRASDLVQGIRSLVKKDALYQEALDNGAFGGDMVSQEIRDNILKPILNQISVQTTNTQRGAMGTVMRFTHLLWEGAQTWDQRAKNLYRLEDEIFRMATYIRRRQQGSTQKDAAREANEQFLNYDIRAPWVNALRKTALPFLAYSYRAVPRLAHTLMTRPWKILKYATLAYGANYLAYALAPSGDGEDDERRSMRDEEQGRTWLGMPRMMRLPWIDKNGNPMFLDIRRWIPAGDVFDTNQGQLALPILPAPLQIGGPLLLAFEFILNKKAFDGKEIVNTKTDDMWKRAGKVADWAWKSWMPNNPLFPATYSQDKILNAATGVRDRQGRPYDVGTAVASSFGIKLHPQDVAEARKLRKFEFDRADRELKAESRRLARDLSRNMISRNTYDSEIARLTKTRAELQKKLMEKLPARSP